jgi:hypothetical protein
MKKLSNLLYLQLFLVPLLTITQFSSATEKEEAHSSAPFFKAPLTKIDNKKSHSWWVKVFKHYGLLDSNENRVLFLQDADQKEFILKSHYGDHGPVREKLGTKIAKSAHINVNDVEIFPRGIEGFSSIPTTLHTRVPGIQVSDIFELYRTVRIKEGLAKKCNLESIVKHPKLAPIVAVNLFINNPDCHNGNLFFDNQSQEFHLIDLNHAFDCYSSAFVCHTDPAYILPPDLLATQACDFLENLKEKDLSPEKIHALSSVAKTLEKLIIQYHPTQLCNDWRNVLQKNRFYDEVEQERTDIMLEYNYHENKRLLSQLKTIIEDYHKTKRNSTDDIFKPMIIPTQNVEYAFWHTMNS